MKYKITLFLLLLSNLATANKYQERRHEGVIRGGALTGEITSGAAIFSYHTDFTSIEGARNNLNVANLDLLWSTWWFYRIEGDGNETKFPAPDAADYTGNVATLTWNDVDGRGMFSATLVHTLDQPMVDTATLINNMTITSLSGSEFNIEVFHYLDMDIDGAANDEASLVTANNHMVIVDNQSASVANNAEFRAGGDTAFKVNAYSTIDILATLVQLLDLLVDDLDNSGLPFGPADFTGSFQWSVEVAADGYASVESTVGVGVTAPIPILPILFNPDVIFENGFEEQ